MISHTNKAALDASSQILHLNVDVMELFWMGRIADQELAGAIALHLASCYACRVEYTEVSMFCAAIRDVFRKAAASSVG